MADTAAQFRGARKWTGSWLALAAIVAATLAVLGALLGPVSLSLSQMAPALAEAATGAEPSDRGASAILLQIRLPRVLLGAAVGAGLALSGCALQGIFRNPLADPGLIGVTAGAAVGAVTMIVLGATLSNAAEDLWTLLPATPAWLFDWLPGSSTAYGYLSALRPSIPLAAFAGAGLATWFIFRISQSGETGSLSVVTLLLAGIAVNAIAGAVIGGLVYVSDDQQLRDLTFWSMGSLGAADWPSTFLAVLAIGLAAFGISKLARALDLFQIGERAAFHSGVDVERVKWRIGALCALAVGAATAVAGPIGFIGLVAPHLARLMAGPSHRIVIPLSALIGASLALGSDLFVRLIVPPAEPPIGIATSLIGGPFFLWLLLQRAKRGGLA